MLAQRARGLTWKDSPGVWFSMLCNALAEHDFSKAAEAKENLARLGVKVRFENLATMQPHRDAGCSGEGVVVNAG
jgi:hypothetical protein